MDEKLILTTLNNYMNGGTDGDKEQLRSAFHPNATIKFIKEGSFSNATLEEFLSWPAIGKKHDRSCRVVSYHFTGNIGTAHLVLEYESFRFIDFFNLIKVDQRWYISDKVFYRQEK